MVAIIADIMCSECYTQALPTVHSSPPGSGHCSHFTGEAVKDSPCDSAACGHTAHRLRFETGSCFPVHTGVGESETPCLGLPRV